MTTQLRIDQITEAAADLESVFADPTCFASPGTPDPRPVQDYAASLASEFVGEYRDDAIVGALGRMVTAEDSGDPKASRRNLLTVRRKLATRLTEWQRNTDTKPQLADSQGYPRAA